MPIPENHDLKIEIAEQDCALRISLENGSSTAVAPWDGSTLNPVRFEAFRTGVGDRTMQFPGMVLSARRVSGDQLDLTIEFDGGGTTSLRTALC